MSRLPGARQFPAPASAESYYMPGVGRGVVAYTKEEIAYNMATTADPFGKPPPGYIPGKGRGATGFSGGVSRDDAADDRDTADLAGNNNELNCENEQLFKDVEIDDEDLEAESVYNLIDAKMDQRRKSHREGKIKDEILKMRSEKPTISQQLEHFKRDLMTLTKDEWESIPEIGDYSAKKKRQKRQVYTPAPDSLIYSSRAAMQSSTSIGTATPLGISTPLGIMGGSATPVGLKTPLGLRTPAGNASSLNDLGEARGAVLSITLDKVMDNLSGQTVVDPKGYLTDLNSTINTDMVDIERVRSLLRYITNTNPKHAFGWISAARIEEQAGKLEAARELISQGCQNCPDKEDVWLEAARLEKPDYAKAILAKAIKVLPSSVKLWLEAANRETLDDNRKRVLRKALEFIPNSVRLWKEAISMENETDAYILLKRAVECVPDSVDMWLSLARLCPYEEAQKVLNEARKRLPTNVDIWITASKLEESNGNDQMVERIITRALDNLAKKGVVHIRSNWLKHAKVAETNGFVKTAQAIIKATMMIGVDANNKKETWLEDGEQFLESGAVECARAIYKNAIEQMKTKKSLWLALVELESKHGTPESIDEALKSAVTYCPKSEVLWLMAAKHKWVQGDIPAAREILKRGLAFNEDAEAISLAAVKIERENGEYERARKLLEQARTQCNSKKVWMQSVQLERQLKNYQYAIELVEQGIDNHPHFDKLWMISGQMRMEIEPRDIDAAIAVYKEGKCFANVGSRLLQC
ncbi:conserved hypothetical protein [Theileria equi strain WA]|uniref:Uncharacterized protein n=1 Tax=Theileria equi strain WA TaxID=1537102 RepID=L1LEV8_THEEQ|nr:conserved hypothetical protein [Theileria equi strain WA]EKX73881.1 conserved hypothetical protein [Theileria equi strain WA]|eukprot:XP_004833333.1 conserved hypothetical protein [Theileria equi strain WA]